MKIEKLMTCPVVTVTAETPLKEVAALLTEHHISGVPVADGVGSVLGVVSEADILRKERGFAPGAGRRFSWLLRRFDGELDKLSAQTAGEAMTSPALTVRPTGDVSAAAHLMVERRINRLPVVERGALVGIVTRADIVRAFSRADAELALEIREEVLRRTMWMDPDSLGLDVTDGVVTVWGAVDTDADVDGVVANIRRVPGVLDVHPDLRSRAREEHARRR
jgi:CBS domain-containing protein